MRELGRVWVVGGSGGIGYEIMSQLLKDDQDPVSTDESVDVRKFADLRRFVSRNGPFDTIIYCAGINYLDWSKTINTAEMQDLFDVNVTGLVRVLQVEPDATNVCVVGSDAAWRPMRTSVAYCASKAALHMAIQVIGRERGDEDFRIFGVAPGKVRDTAMTAYVDKRSAELRPEMDHIAYQQSQIPGGKFVRPDEVAEFVTMLLRTDSDYLNGAIIPFNGGRS